jgi:hypothetical protein
MATKRPAKPRLSPLQEATDPTTAPERLRELGLYHDQGVRRAVWKNASLPEEVWREVLLRGEPEPWANPMAPIYLLTGIYDFKNLHNAARWATGESWRNPDPDRCSPEGKALIAAKLQEWWATSESAEDMMLFFGLWAYTNGKDSAEHREVVRITVLCARTSPDLTTRDHEALDLLDAWSQGGVDERKKAQTLSSAQSIKDTFQFALDPHYMPWSLYDNLMKAVSSGKQGIERKEAMDEHSRLLADLIRRERPLPPVVQ